MHGILVQLPLPKHIDKELVIDMMRPDKDVDGFSPVNMGALFVGKGIFVPGTPKGIIKLIESTGVPMEGKLQGLDALLSTVQMPKGIPVGTMAIGKTGAANGCLFAAQILALQDRALLHRLQNYRQKMTQEVLRKNEKLHSK